MIEHPVDKFIEPINAISVNYEKLLIIKIGNSPIFFSNDNIIRNKIFEMIAMAGIPTKY